jgi:hypothetical protein
MDFNSKNIPRQRDKVLNNTFNQGEQNYEEFSGVMKVHDSVFSNYEDQLGDNIVEKRTLKNLDDEMYMIFEQSEYYEKYKKYKRIEGNDRLKMYYYFKQELSEGKKYTNMEIFIAFAEFFQVNYDQLYSEVGVLDKECLLKELNEKYSLSHKIKTKKLF